MRQRFPEIIHIIDTTHTLDVIKDFARFGAGFGVRE
jgi:hypothetical protein